MKPIKKLIIAIKIKINEFKHKRQLKKRMEEIRKQDPFIYD